MRAKVVAVSLFGAAACADMPAPPAESVAVVEFQLNVEEAASAGCSTKIVEGLSKQIVQQAECASPGSFIEVPKRPNMVFGSAVLPYMEQPARDALLKAVDANKSTTLTINSMLRSVAQQYLLYRWYVNGQCSIGLAAKPGTSNHETGLALDVQNYATWRPHLKTTGFTWFGTGDPVHFDYTGAGAVSQASVGVKAFQRLWNLNHPNDLIGEDGAYGPQTEARLKQAPAGGFAVGLDPSCASSGSGGSGGSGGGGGGGGGGTGGSGGDSPLTIPAQLSATFADAFDTFTDGPSKGVSDLVQGHSYELVITAMNTGDSVIDALDVTVALPDSLASQGTQSAAVSIAGPISPGKTAKGSLKVDARAYSVLAVAPHEIGLSTPSAQGTAKVDVYSERRWEFDGERLEGWTSQQLLAVTSEAEIGMGARDGELVLSGAAPDLAATSALLDITTAGLGDLTLLARRSGDSGGVAKLYLDDTGIELALPADGDLHEVTIPEAALPRRVTRVRFVPFEGGTAKSTSAAIAHLRIGEELTVPSDGAAGCTCTLGPTSPLRAPWALAAFGAAAVALVSRRRASVR